MWTSENRGRYDRGKLRYPSDLTDEEWALVAPLIPAAKRGGNKRTVNLREVANGLMYILSTGGLMGSSNRGSLCKALLSGRPCAGFRVVFAATNVRPSMLSKPLTRTSRKNPTSASCARPSASWASVLLGAMSRAA